MQEDFSPTPPSDEAAASAKAVRSGIWNALSWVRDLAFSVLIAVILIVFIYQPVKVEGTSMTPTLTDQERIFINKFTYHFGLGDIQRGDMVRIEAGQVFVNGQSLEEPYVPEEFRDRVSYEERRVPDGQYFVLGDHRNSSSDSRTWGFVKRDAIYGKAVFVYWPLKNMGR